MTRIERIAEELETSVYKDPMHGQIAKANFLYGAAQQKIEAEEEREKIRGLFQAGEVRLATIQKANGVLVKLLRDEDLADRERFIEMFNHMMEE